MGTRPEVGTSLSIDAFDIGALVVAVVLILVSAVLVAIEAALGRVSRSRAAELERSNRRGATTLVEVLEDRAKHINVLLLLHQTATVAAIVLVAVLVRDGLESAGLAVLVAVGVMAFVVYVFLGVGARTLGTQRADDVSRWFAGPTRALGIVLGPFSRILILVGNALTPGTGYRQGPFTTEAELLEMVDLASDSLVIEDEEREMIHSVFEFGDTIAREVMVPRTEIVHVESDCSLQDAMAVALETGHSRVPVIGENVDDIVGVVYLKDMARRTFEDANAASEFVRGHMRPALLVPDTKRADELLRQMQTARVHMAILVDEYGGTSGLATFEDLVEEIVGEITDEYDTQTLEYEERGDGTYLVSTRMRVADFADLIDVEIDAEKDGIETVGGLVAARLGHVPREGSTLRLDGWVLVASAVTDARRGVQTVVVSRVGQGES